MAVLRFGRAGLPGTGAARRSASSTGWNTAEGRERTARRPWRRERRATVRDKANARERFATRWFERPHLERCLVSDPLL